MWNLISILRYRRPMHKLTRRDENLETVQSISKVFVVIKRIIGFTEMKKEFAKLG